jgi:hypothetical protein
MSKISAQIVLQSRASEDRRIVEPPSAALWQGCRYMVFPHSTRSQHWRQQKVSFINALTSEGCSCGQASSR